MRKKRLKGGPGPGENATSHAWFKSHLNQQIIIEHDTVRRGVLLAWDNYAVLLETADHGNVLVHRAPGMAFRDGDTHE